MQDRDHNSTELSPLSSLGRSFIYVESGPSLSPSRHLVLAELKREKKKTRFCTLSGQLIMDFDYSHFVLLSAGRLAERPAPLIVSVSGLIEPNGNGCCQSSLFSSVYALIHQRDIHYHLAENSSGHLHTHADTHLHLVFIWITGLRLSPGLNAQLHPQKGINAVF